MNTPTAHPPPGLLLALNCGSSSIRFAAFDTAQRPLSRQPAWHGKIDGITGPDPTFSAGGDEPRPVRLDPGDPYRSALNPIRQGLKEHLYDRRLVAVVHRVVHGGGKYQAPVPVDAGVLAELRSYVPLAPLHQPFALDCIDAFRSSDPELPQIACFDTAFHHTMPLVEQMLPLPYDAWEQGLRRYGFHGLSYEYLSIALEERHGEAARGRTIVAHLGSGASLCAMQDLKSVTTTMGFSALDGLMMGTRCGSLDPGALLHLMKQRKLNPDEAARLLYQESGLLGISGVSPDPRVLLAKEAGDERVRLALALYTRRIAREVAALTAVLGGLDMLVFTAGIGEHNAVIRRRVCDGLGFLGVSIDDGANAAHASLISAAESRVMIAVEPTNEEWIAAGHGLSLLAGL